MPIIQKPEHIALQTPKQLNDIDSIIYTKDEIKEFNLSEAINDHPLAKRPTSIRSKLAYKELIANCKPSKRYMLPGWMCLFGYSEPKLKEDLEFYDRSPLVLFFGITRTKEGNIREVGINLHYYPPFTRLRILKKAYEVYKPFFDDNFNSMTGKPNKFISWSQLEAINKHNYKLGFGVKMYIPVLRQTTWMVPTRLFQTAFYTEGHFSKATMQQIFRFWRQF